MLTEIAEEIFSFFEKKGFPALATEIGSCDNPDLNYHTNRMLKVYNKNKKTLGLIKIPKACQELYDLMMKLAILFHDLGKLNCFFQYGMLNIKRKKKKLTVKKNWSYHTGLSSFIGYLFLFYIKKNIKSQFKENQDEDLNFLLKNFEIIIINGIICHHSALYRAEQRNEFNELENSEEYHANRVFYFLKYLVKISEDFIGEIEQNELNCGLEWIPDPEQKLQIDLYRELKVFFRIFSEAVSKRENDKEFVSNFILDLIRKFNNSIKYKKKVDNKNQILFFYIVHLSSVLTNLDKWEAKTTRSSLDSVRKIEFTKINNETSVDKPHVCINEYKKLKKRHSNLDPFREKFARIIEEKKQNSDLRRIYSLTAPCGIGKTLAVLDFAFDLREKFYNENNYYSKIIYALPFISICDQLEEILKELFKEDSQTEFLSVHHTMAEFEKNYDEDEEENVKQDNAYLNSYEIRNWYSEIIVTTTVKLFNTMLKFQKHTLTRFHRMANSIVIIDEYHSIPKKYHEIIRIYLKTFSTIFNTTFILLTATTPALFKEKDKIIELTLSNNRKDPQQTQIALFNQINRYKIRYYHEKYTLEMFEEYCEQVIEENPDKSIMIVVNTRNLAMSIYEYLKGLKSDKEEKRKKKRIICHLSGNMIPLHRKRVLRRIDSVLDENSKGNNIILVTTQLIEAGVDISFQKIIRDLGPFYSIVQVAGRCNRNWEIQNEVELPKIDVINIEDSHKNVYDNYEIEQTIKYFKQHRVNKDDDYTELAENTIREKFHEYSEKLDHIKRRDHCLEEFKELKFEELTRNFELIKDLPKIPIVVIPDKTIYDKNLTPKLVLQERKLLDKMRRNELAYFPSKLYRFIVEIYEGQKGIIENLSFNLEHPRNQKTKKVFEKFDRRNILFYILDMKNDDAKRYYSQEIGLQISE